MHRWSVTEQAACDVLDADFAAGVCTTTHLRGAVELTDGIGNDNGLGESFEECLYSPNIGAYQGRGALVSVPFSDGALVGVTLVGFDQQ